MALSIIIITLALVFYTIGVWAERTSKTLKGWHVLMFALGLSCDAFGTYLMTLIPNGTTISSAAAIAVMEFTGALALILMALHLAWAVYTYYKGSERQKQKFHKYSLIVWIIWLIPYISGAYSAMSS